MRKLRWTDEEVSLLVDKYPLTPTEELKLLFSGRSWDSVKLKANNLGLFREVVESRDSDLSVLLEDVLLTYYWVGFLMADGTINHDTMRLKLCLAVKDKDHVIRFAEWIKCPNHRDEPNDSYGVAAQDKALVPQIVAKYDFRRSKTYNPPDLSYLAGDKLVAFLIGLIDGDGQIRKQYQRRDSVCIIKMHSSWLGVLQYLSAKIHAMCGVSDPVPSINKQGYAEAVFANSVVLRFLKQKAVEWKLPVLLRKWRLIDEGFYGRIEESRKRRAEILTLRESGLSGKEIARRCKVSESCVSQTINGRNRKEVV